MKIRIIHVICILVLMVVGCEKDDFTYQGPLQVEFNSPSYYNTSAGYPVLAYNYTWTNTGAYMYYNIAKVGLDSARIALIGAQQSKDIYVGYQVVDSVFYNSATSTVQLTFPEWSQRLPGDKTWKTTAVLNTNYSFVEAGGVTTIPANSSFGYIYFNCLQRGTPALSTDVWLTLTDNSDVKVTKYRIMRLRI